MQYKAITVTTSTIFKSSEIINIMRVKIIWKEKKIALQRWPILIEISLFSQTAFLRIILGLFYFKPETVQL